MTGVQCVKQDGVTALIRSEGAGRFSDLRDRRQMLHRLHLSGTSDDARFGPLTWLLIRIAGWVVAIHWAEIAVWALLYRWQNCLPDFESSLYFSTVTYTTVGYGDLVLAKGWAYPGRESRRSLASSCAVGPRDFSLPS